MNTSRIVLAGGSGFLGSVLAQRLANTSRDIVVLTRTPGSAPPRTREALWDGATLGPWQKELDGAAAVINLAGRSVDCRYHARNRRLILNSRVGSTRVLGAAIAACASPPPVWLNSSTATIYRHSLERPMDEAGEIGATPEAKDAFSVEVARAWEETFDAARVPKTRKVALRTAMVLSAVPGGVFPVLRRLVRFGLGGTMASGRQFVSWIHETDFARAVEWLMHREDLFGPVNLVAPQPLPNREMMTTLRTLCGIPVGLPASLWMLEAGAFFLRTETELLIKSRRAVPGRLLASGFNFQFSQFHDACLNLLAQPVER
jgi:uncharacterized protein (TIGR01777 family)